MRKAMLGLFLVVPLAWAGAAFSAEAPPARQQGIGGTVKVQANSVMRLPKRAQSCACAEWRSARMPPC